MNIDARTTFAFYVALAVTGCGIATAQQETAFVDAACRQRTPAALEEALSRIAAMRLRVACDVTFELHVPRHALFERWGIGESVVRRRSHVYVSDGIRWRFVQSRSPDDDRPFPDQMACEFVYDGVQVRSAHGELLVVHSIASLTSERDPADELFRCEYFDSIGLRLPCTPSRLGSLPGSQLLHAIYHGATCTESADEPGVWRVDQVLPGGVSRRSWLRSDRGFAVVRWEDRVDGRLRVRGRNEDFVRHGEVHLPRTSTAQVHGWYTVPGDESPEPLMTRVVHVTDVGEPTAADLRLTQMSTGTVVQDRRFSAPEAGDESYLVYSIAVSPEELLARYLSSARSVGDLEPEDPGPVLSGQVGDWRGVWLWAAAHVAALVAFTTIIMLRGRMLSGARPVGGEA